MRRLLFCTLILFCAASCGRRNPASVKSQPMAFIPVLPPSDLRGGELTDYMRMHYWDRFDFADTLFLSRADTMQMLDSYAAYISLYVGQGNSAPIDSLMRRASVSRPMLEYFRMLAERVLHDPNSPLRDDELYIPVLKAVVESPWYDQWERIAPEHDLRLVMQNRIGAQANDFRYTLASGAQGTLYGLNADYTIVLFSNPGCPMCHELREEIGASPMLNELIERGDVKVLTIYPDEDVAAWREYLKEMPLEWVNAYDKGGVIIEQGLYDMKAIPALYLLDGSKRVLLKDSTSVPQVEEILFDRSYRI